MPTLLGKAVDYFLGHLYPEYGRRTTLVCAGIAFALSHLLLWGAEDPEAWLPGTDGRVDYGVVDVLVVEAIVVGVAAIGTVVLAALVDWIGDWPWDLYETTGKVPTLAIWAVTIASMQWFFWTSERTEWWTLRTAASLLIWAGLSVFVALYVCRVVGLFRRSRPAPRRDSDR